MRPSILVACSVCTALLAFAVAAPPPAQACSGLPCTLPAAFPVPEGGILPANFGELTVFSQGTTPRAVGYTLKLWEAGSPDQVLRVAEVGASNQHRADLGGLLAPGKTYVVEASSCAMQFGRALEPSIRTLQFTLAQGASDPPSTLGTLTVARHGQTTVAWGGGAGCYYALNTDAVDLSLDASALPEPWRKLVNSYQLMVDGAPFSWTLTIGSDDFGPKDRARGFYFGEPGTFRAFTECGPAGDEFERAPPGERGLSQGKHTVWVEARVPTSPAKIVESERIEIELACPEAPADGGTDAASAPDERDDAGHPSRTDEPDDEAMESTTTRKTTGSCSLTSRTRSSLGPALGLLVLALTLLRRKKTVRPRHT